MLALSESHINQLVQGMNQFLWPFLRVAGVMLSAPVLGDNRIPPRIKVGICVALTVVIAPSIDPVPFIEPLTGAGLLVAANQLLAGVSIGFMLTLAFNAFVVAGEKIAMMMGLGYALMNDPASGVQVPIISQFYMMFISLLFLAFDGHHELIRVLSMSFTLFPVGTAMTGNMFWFIVEWSSILFAGALQVALPALSALLTVNLVLGVITRSAPQLNLFSVGFPITMTVGFLVILLTLPSVASLFQQFILLAFDTSEIFLETR